MPKPAAWILYHTDGCHLCEQAQALLDGLGQSYQLQDIFGHDVLMAAYGTSIPVLQSQRTAQTLSWPFDSAALTYFMELES
jgi:hypothetical protein